MREGKALHLRLTTSQEPILSGATLASQPYPSSYLEAANLDQA